MRDRMIIYRDCFDMDACFNLLVTQAQFRGGNPSDPYNWELPAEFFEKYWFLTIKYVLKAIFFGLRQFCLNCTNSALTAMI
jgi:hypothetical protein